MEQDMISPHVLTGGDINVMSANIPGGVFLCRFDAQLTLLQINDTFLSMLGYTRQDILELFHDGFLNMIYSGDRDEVCRKLNAQIENGSEVEIEHRIVRKNGDVIWVLDKARLTRDDQRGDCLFCLLVDITRHREAEERLRLTLERHQIVMAQSNSIIFEWDIRSNTFDFSNNWLKRFGAIPGAGNPGNKLNDIPYVEPEDKPKVAEVLQRIRNGARYAEAEARITDANGASVWRRVRITGISDEHGEMVRAVGVLVDIDSEKREAQILIERAQRDSLTNLYNKASTQERIKLALAKLAPGSTSALLIIDMDNFKNVNDSMGHLFGDAMLVEVAHTLQKQFRSDDIVGRVGGDEFIVFIDHIPRAEIACRKANQIMRALSEMSVRELANIDILCSIGIAVYPECGHTYNELFQSADEALYRAKSMGRNQYCMSDPNHFPGNLTVQPRSAVNARIDSDDTQESTSAQLIKRVFQILYKSVDLDAAVNNILSMVGEQFDVSRAYIFEDDETGKYCSNTFEWCAPDVEPKISILQHISYAQTLSGNYYDNFNENGVFYCRDVSTLDSRQYDILKAQGIKSVLQCAIYDNGRSKGFVGFDECRQNRFWTQEQVDVLAFISEMLGTFLLKMRAKDRAVQNARAMESILDTQQAWTYIVRQDTFEILYANRKTVNGIPSTYIGARCHEAFFHSPAQCVTCPVLALDNEQQHYVCQLYNPFLNQWARADASYITWYGEKAILLSCYEVNASSSQ